MNFLNRQVRFDCWANQESLKAIEEAEGDTSGAVKIAGHIAGISDLWLSRIDRACPALSAGPQLTVAEIRATFLDHQNRWLTHCTRYSAEAVVRYTSRSGETSDNSFGEIVQEVALHGAHHRGQIALLLRMQSSAPPESTDFIPALRRNCF